ncbi:MAG: hypothetical protein JRI23_12365, partial [Deltaproteobacteria bacterium]|nr:hypothetical protein [Deltaproteobacteria bacterium]MBW2532506.1 hypothetical protein [Deltaproteobacteria bacterium]
MTPSSISRVLVLAVVVTAPASVEAATHAVPSSVTTVDPSYDGGVQPGDVLVLEAGQRGTLVLEDLVGDPSAPIEVRVDAATTQATVIDGAGSTWGLEVDHCEHVVIDGTTSGGPYYGILVTTSADQHHTYVKLRNRSRFITLRRIEVAGVYGGNPGIGISFNDHNIKRVDYPGFWVEGHKVLDCFVHDVGTEGMYLGPNNQNTDDEPHLRDIEIAYNRVEHTGWDCINPKSWVDGDNSIHHNVLRDCGYRGTVDGEQASGIPSIAFHGEIYNNWVENTAGRGIVNYGLGIIAYENPDWEARIYNNVLVDIGGFGEFEGIKVFTPVEIFNNTIVRTTAEAIYGASIASGLVHDNLMADAAAGPIRLGGLTERDNWFGTVADARFEDAAMLDFHLTDQSPAYNAVTEPGFAPFDFDDVARPQEGAADYGAFEYHVDVGGSGGAGGAGGAGAGAEGGSGGSGGAAGSTPTGPATEVADDGGCGCRLVAADRPGAARFALALLGFALYAG